MQVAVSSCLGGGRSGVLRSMRSASHERRALRPILMLLCVAIATAACREPEVTYGEHAVLRQRTSSAGEGGQAGLMGVAGSAGVAGTSSPIEDAPDLTPPVELPDSGMHDARAIDASMDSDDDLDPSPYCPPVPFELFEPTAQGDGSSSGCETFVCATQISVDSNSLAPIAGSWDVYDPLVYFGCTAIIGDLIVHNYYGSDLSALSCLEVLGGSLFIVNAPNLTNLDGLDALQYVGEDLSIARSGPFTSDASSLTDISALAKLHVVVGSFAIRAPALTSLNGLEQLGAVGDNFEVELTERLTDLRGLSGLRGIGGDLLLKNVIGLSNLQGLDALETIGGSLHLNGTTALRTTIGALPAVSCIGGNIEVQGPNLALEFLDALPVLERVGGDVAISGNGLLRTISVLDNVAHVRGSIAVQENGALSQLNLSALGKLGGVMVVTDNPQLEECPLIELAGTLGKADSSQIHGNARVLSSDCTALGAGP